jgi:hypothetical protein
MKTENEQFHTEKSPTVEKKSLFYLNQITIETQKMAPLKHLEKQKGKMITG